MITRYIVSPDPDVIDGVEFETFKVANDYAEACNECVIELRYTYDDSELVTDHRDGVRQEDQIAELEDEIQRLEDALAHARIALGKL